ncbi:MAG TPA: DUF3141 domain-containing protein [Dongiaceae bacterium]|nr:DUF3141 domain-containing protein [Dongiaceae bacterium]
MSTSVGLNPVQDYLVDAWQRTILCLDTLRQRGNIYFEHNARTAPHVLKFDLEVVRDGRHLPRPVNYGLIRVLPPAGVEIDPAKPPIVVVDPRAGHGPGIGGMKQESEIGVALAAGHPCYFIGFLPQPVPGQTIEDVCRAEAAFIEEVAALHPGTNGKPIIIANCQAGWQIAMMAALNPDLAGPILLAGSPLSYWQGHRGKNPLRYLGGVLGGTWLTTLAGDLGKGIFDGANLVSNFELLNPGNTYWQKIYNVYSKVDTETARFLDFETWWGSPVLLNAAEMQWIADNLFVGNKLTAGNIRTTDGVRIDLRNIKSPPPQALGWITDLYAEDEDIVAAGQTIVYCLHQNIGHLGIFVSGKVASREHGEFVNCMDLIDMMPPGLFEAVITEVDEDTENAALIQGRYLLQLEHRKLDDVRAICGQEDDNPYFATVARLSEVNRSLYETFLAPAIRTAVTEQSAEAMRAMHPNRLRFAMFSDRNPWMQPIEKLAEAVRAARQPASAENPLTTVEAAASHWIEESWEAFQQMRDWATETAFLTTYGSPLLRAMVGLGEHAAGDHAADGGRLIERDLQREAAAARLRASLEERFEAGGTVAALLRAIIYIRLPGGSVDERGFAALKAVRAAQPARSRMDWATAKELIKEQYLLLQADEERAVEAIRSLLPETKKDRSTAREIIHRVVTARGALPAESAVRLARIDRLFGLDLDEAAAGKVPANEVAASKAVAGARETTESETAESATSEIEAGELKTGEVAHA